MAAVLKHWREAATLILFASKVSSRSPASLTKSVNKIATDDHQQDINDLPAGTNDHFEVLMMKRSSKSKVMPNLHVFPGGVADDSDFSSRWLSVFQKLGKNMQKALFSKLTERSFEASPMFTRQRDPKFSVLPPDVAFRICAIREAFEESGVLLARPAGISKKHVEHLCAEANDENAGVMNTACAYDDSQVIRKWRDRVNQEPSQFLVMCLQLGLVPEIWCLHEWSNWLTPIEGAENRRRFDAVFYVCCIHHKQGVEQDLTETVKSMWASPSSLLSANFHHQLVLGPPQIYELARLLHFTSAQDLLEFLSMPGRARVERWFPVTAVCKDHILSLMPGDDLYPENPDQGSQLVLFFDESLEDLNKKHPKQHRRCFSFESKMFLPFFNIKPLLGHVGPEVNALKKLLPQTKL
ncbi:hydroxyacid-oxoacid transhydrogenase, mitochondrial [Plakobranchus ocellatus]|uniref:Hydroxyacid-oxoacid transhydrogenase, mitochondrial n=1 Tax=Plakobranchus ocellatus TaxID=259542 RepID=A0AAV3ZXQ5_9GAST|nr:hydroxyacid-oxoacid transhydrogenase, mitochondrial [Plakobranchus ocellatus]